MKIIGDKDWIESKVPSSVLAKYPDSLCLVDMKSKIPKDVDPKFCIGIAERLSPGAVMNTAVTKGLWHVVQSHSPRFLQELELAAEMILRPSTFLSSPEDSMFVGTAHRNIEFRFSNSKQKETVLAQVEAQLKGIAHVSLIREAALTIADELFTNAIFNGPVDPGNHPRNAHLRRNIPVQLEEGKEARIFMAFAEEWLLIGCEDPFGSYVNERILCRIQDCYQRGVSAAINMGSGGAGIGCRMMFELSTGFYTCVDPGMKTVVCYLLPLGQGLRQKEAIPKNLHMASTAGGNMGQLRVTETKSGDSVSLEFFGSIDEDSDFTKISMAGAKDAKLDLGGVTAINSCGIREWIRWVRGVPSTIRVNYVKCPKIIIDQINMIEGFLPQGATVQSFYVPYYCEACENVTSVLFTRGQEFHSEKDGGKLDVKGTMRCSNCGKDAEMDVIESQYFRFLEDKT
ncbi:MAG: hypothetical protein ACXWPM_01550 [Bdellovibrionota bacterium]